MRAKAICKIRLSQLGFRFFGPRPNFQISLAGREKKWLEWEEGGRHHGLAAFQVDADGLVSKEPTKTIPRRKPWQSARQWGRC